MRILEINTEKTWRGGEKQTLLTAQGLKEKGVEVEILCRKKYPLATKAQHAAILCHQITGQLQALLFLAIHGKHYDLIHVQTAKAQGFAVLTKPFHKKKIIYTRRVDFMPRGYPARFKFHYTDKVVAISHAIAHILQKFGVQIDQIIPSAISRDTIPASYSSETKAAILKEKQQGKTIVLTIAALVPHKDPHTLLKAIRKVHAKARDVVFFHCGSGDLEQEIREEAKKQDMLGYYSILGFVDNAESLLPLADVFVMSSQEEGLGSTVLEAFRYTVPVASTDAGGLKEIVTDHGLIGPVHDAEKLAENILLLLSNPDLCKKLTTKAYDYVMGHHSQKIMVERYISLFQKMA